MKKVVWLFRWNSENFFFFFFFFFLFLSLLPSFSFFLLLLIPPSSLSDNGASFLQQVACQATSYLSALWDIQDPGLLASQSHLVPRSSLQVPTLPLACPPHFNKISHIGSHSSPLRKQGLVWITFSCGSQVPSSSGRQTTGFEDEITSKAPKYASSTTTTITTCSCCCCCCCGQDWTWKDNFPKGTHWGISQEGGNWRCQSGRR